MIKCLSKEVQAKLRSGIAIFSLQQCVEELILNSIDAEATCIAVKIDLVACKVQVVDNGSGMEREDMENVGTRYYTSKCCSLEDLDKICFYGFRGEAIASIVSLAGMVEISSRTKLSVKTHVKIFDEGKGLDVFEAQTTRPCSGTTVSICSFFYNMPVRRKRMDSVLELEQIRQRVEAISLMHPSVSFTVKKECSNVMLVQLSKARNTYYRFVQIHGLGRAQKLGEIHYTHGQFEMTGHIGREGHYSSSLQFLFVNRRLLLKTRIHKLLNNLLRRVSSVSKQNSPGGSHATTSPKLRTGTDVHGVYVINISCPQNEYDICLEPAKTLIEFKDWDNVLLFIEEGVKAFLTKENLVTEYSMRNSQDDGSPTVFDDQDNSAEGVEDDLQHISGDCEKEMMLSSHTVHRKLGGDFKGTGRFSAANNKLVATVEESHTVQDQEAQSIEQNLQCVSLNAEPKLNTDLDTEIDFQQDELVHQLPTSTSRPSVVMNKEGIEDQDSVFSGKADHELELNVINNSVTLSLSANILDVEQAAKNSKNTDKKAISPIQNFAPKRKLSLLEDQNVKRHYHSGCPSSVVSKVTLCQNFAGSLDKFRRMYGKDADTTQQSLTTSGTDVSKATAEVPETLAELHEENELMCHMEESPVRQEIGTKPGHKRPLQDSPPTLSAYTELKSTAKQTKKNKTSLAAKLSHLTHYKKKDKRLGSESEDSLDIMRNCLFKDVGKPDLVMDEQSNDNCASFTSMPGTRSPTSTSGTMPSSFQMLCFSGSHSLPGKTLTSASLDEPQPLNLTLNTDGKAPEEGKESENDCINSESSKWQMYFDEPLGKFVYINEVTGLSKYEAPSEEESAVSCTSDVTNMAVSVLSNKDDTQGPSALETLFSEWNNPVFIRPPEVAVDVTVGQAEGLAVKVHNILFPYRFTKDMMHSMQVIHQVDKKFLVCLMNTTDKDSMSNCETEGNLVVLIDQHAAHERVRLERLVAESYEDDPDMPGQRRLCSSRVTPPLEISVCDEEIRLLRSCRPFLKDLALEVSFPQTEKPHVLLEKVPTCFIEKEKTEMSSGRQTVIRSIAEEYVRELIELVRSTGRVRGTLPLTVHNVLASQACHGAIKFNHSLSKEESRNLVRSLSTCQLPFQCAHGRPSMTPLVDLLHLSNESQEPPKPNLRKLRRMCKAWQLYGKD
ncbi:DNA mismatch repair protein Mlh3 [Chanos chanos]|uniref:DNA mismatch repair protein Mlh3 n=1 Tax=Chanos chanos TaxID=29144 RepID=A0A6J2UY96_CHACN|nr:DNA mismatch repair protein Mlh3 [Chanos chanos]